MGGVGNLLSNLNETFFGEIVLDVEVGALFIDGTGLHVASDFGTNQVGKSSNIEIVGKNEKLKAHFLGAGHDPVSVPSSRAELVEFSSVEGLGEGGRGSLTHVGQKLNALLDDGRVLLDGKLTVIITTFDGGLENSGAHGDFSGDNDILAVLALKGNLF